MIRLRDLTESILASNQLAERKNLLDSLPVPVWRRDQALGIEWCNRAYAHAVGVDQSEAISSQMELGSSRESFGRNMARRAMEKGLVQTERLHTVIRGQRRLLQISEKPLTGESEAPGTIGFALDLTDVEQTRSELERHIAAHEDVLEHLSTAVAIYGPDKHLQFYNSAFSQLWQLEDSWLETKPSFADILEILRDQRRLPESVDFRAYKNQWLAKFTDLLQPEESLLHLPDGTTLRVLIAPHPLGGLLHIYEDVTSRIQLETSYNTLMAVQHETINNLAEGIAVFGSDGRLKLSNSAFLHIWELTPEDLAEEPHVTQLITRMGEAFENGGAWNTFRETFLNNALGRGQESGRATLSSGTVLEYAFLPLPDGAMLCSCLDITAGARAEQALRERNAALKAAERLKVDFLANVSYQLRTPLNAIIGFAEILAKAYFGQLNPRQQEYAEGILEGGQKLFSLVNDILDLSAIEAGYMRLNLSMVDVEYVLSTVVSLTEEWARKHNLILEMHCAPDVGSIIADEQRIKQVLLNLVSNAIRFNRPGGQIMVSAWREGNEALLSVSDNGCGIAEFLHGQVFEPFERADGGPQQGAGLGLALVHSFIDLHGGKVELSSQVDVGTTIICRLPFQAIATGFRED
ncbi:MAG TPA: sensor histidine kinase [Rhodospirillaceae bacterium]|nr:sensor histidine kinase [Rhodospirillaceae bacterium]